MATDPVFFRPPLILGTVALGMQYGNVVRTPMQTRQAAWTVLQAAWDAGIESLDTARAYGVAEERIGGWMMATRLGPRIFTKIPPVRDGTAEEVEAALDASLQALGVTQVAGCMAHRARDLQIPAVAEALRAAVADGRIGRFGASVYGVAEAEASLEVEGVGLLQIPASLLDCRAAEVGLPERAASQGVTVHARSVYTQGILFADPEDLPSHFAAMRPVLRRLRGISDESGVSLASLALRAVVDTPGIASAVIGITRPCEVAEAFAALAVEVPADVLHAARAIARGLPEAVVNPLLWPR